MATEVETKPVTDTVSKAGEVAVGEDMAFQQRWWVFERIVWGVFGLILLADVSGLLGRGPLSKAEAHTADGSLLVKYEKVERANTPSIMTLTPGAPAVHDGAFKVFVSDSIVKELGAQRVVPQPADSVVGDGGVTYTFSANVLPITVQIALQPSFIGSHTFRITVPGQASVSGKVLVLP